MNRYISTVAIEEAFSRLLNSTANLYLEQCALDSTSAIILGSRMTDVTLTY